MAEAQDTSAPSEHRIRVWAPRGALIALALLLIVFVAWGWRTYRQVTALRDQARELAALRVERLDELAPALEQMQEDVVRLRRSLTIPMAVAPYLGWLPRIGPTVQAAPTLLQAGELALSAGTDIWRAMEEPAIAIAVEGDLAGMKALGPAITANAQTLDRAAEDMAHALHLLGTIEAQKLHPRLTKPVAALQRSSRLLRSGMQALPLLPRLLGDEPQTWLLLAQNNDELRATGGFISSIGTLTLGGGIPDLGPLQDSYQIEDWTKPHPDPPEALRQHMGLDLWVTRDANWWPDFPSSAQDVADLYTLNQDTPIDGVIAVDMLGAARIVSALAPLTLPDGTRLGGDEVVQSLRQSWGLAKEALITDGVVITATADYTAIEVELVFEDRAGQVWFDAVELELLDDSGRPSGGGNLAVNGSFEEADSSGEPVGWELVGLGAGDGLVRDVAHTGSHALTLVGERGVDKRLVQRLDVSGRGGDVYRASAQSRGQGITTEGGLYALRVTFVHDEERQRSHDARFPNITHDWATAGTSAVVGQWWRERKDVVNHIIVAAGAKLLNPSQVDALGLLTALSDALEGRHIQFYSRDADLQGFFQRQRWAGALLEAEGDYLLVVDSNVGYNKVSPSVEQAITYEVALDSEGGPLARLTLRYRNTSQKQVDECDKFTTYTHFYEDLVEGCYWNYVRIYGPAGAELIDGRGGDEPVALLSDERGAGERTVWATSLLLEPGEERTLVIEYRLPAEVLLGAQYYALTVQKQAGTDAIPLRVIVSGSGLSPIAESPLLPTAATADRLTYETDLRVDRVLLVALER